LDGVDLPRPKFFSREFIFQKTDVTTIDGKTSRDLGKRKEKFVLGWEMLFESELDRIKTIVEKNTAVTFEIAEDNLVINETNVLTTLRPVNYIIPGENYLIATEIELIEVD
jgi:hypothetical protein